VVGIGDNGTVLARGINSAEALGSAIRPCKGFAPAGRRCSWISYYADMQGAEFAVGVHISTP
jgi:hypothetical protein